MKKLLLFTCLSLLVSTSSSFFAQVKLADTIQKKLDNYAKDNYTEKTYVHTDKSIYLLGEDIWFTGYLLNGVTHQKSLKSRVLYVELLNPKDSVVDQKKLYVEDISVAGDFKIDKEWIPGDYTLRAYTNYMKNDSFHSFFQKTIPVYNLKEKEGSKTVDTDYNTNQIEDKIESSKSKISFYPEGGYLVNGLQSKVTFKVNHKGNDEIKFSGTLKDQEGNIISEIKEIDLGLGTFVMLPETGKQYHVSTTENGKNVDYPLPEPLSDGYVLSTTNTRKSIIINMASNKINGLQNSYLVAHQRGVLLYDIYEQRNVPTNMLKIPTSSLNDGVVNFTLFDNDGHPVAERVVFINNTANKLDLTISNDKEIYNSRDNVAINLSLKNKQGLNEYGFLSMAVRDLNAFPHLKYNNNIQTYLLLNSDLRGEVKNPGYFFEKENDARRNYLLDLIMMTNGWKRFTWQELLNKPNEKLAYDVEEGIYVTGTTYKYKDFDTPIQSVVRLSYFGKFIAQTPIQETDVNGRFKFGPDVYPGSASAIVEGRQEDFLDLSKRSRKLSIVLDDPSPSPILVKKNTLTSNITKKQEDNFIKVTNYLQEIKFENDKEIERLEEVELKVKRLNNFEKRKKEMERRTIYRSPNKLMNRIDMSSLDYTPGSINQVLENNPTVRINNTSDGYLWSRNESEVLIFLDNREIDYNFLGGITCDEIDFIDILTGTATTVFAGTNKACIVLYSKPFKKGTYKADDSVEKKPGVTNFTSQGFYMARKFYSPDRIAIYDTTVKDLRTTLYWQPMIRTTNTSNAKLSFFTSDVKGEYIIEVEGVSISGTPVSAVKTFTVE